MKEIITSVRTVQKTEPGVLRGDIFSLITLCLLQEVEAVRRRTLGSYAPGIIGCVLKSLLGERRLTSIPTFTGKEEILQQSESFQASACSHCDRAALLQRSLITPLCSSPGAVDAACTTELSLRHQKSALSLALIPHKRPGLKPGKRHNQIPLMD